MKGISQRDLAQLRAATDPEIEFTSYFAGADAKTFSGHAALAEYLADLSATWESFQLTAEDFVQVSADRLVVSVRVEARSRRGVQIDQYLYGVWGFRDNKPRRGQTFGTRAEALQAAGLSA
jgi:ketosteroid isomerase-like protein